MPESPATVASLFNTYHQRLGLTWLAGRRGATRRLLPGRDGTSLIGHLSFIHPHCIQLVGPLEFNHLEGLTGEALDQSLERLLEGTSSLVIVADGLTPPETLVRCADRHDTPLFTSPLESNQLMEFIRYYLHDLVAEKTVVHGVFMEVTGIGVLLTGKSAVGKSELALELITRGHRLVADDSPEFTRVAPDTLRGTCPELLYDFLEVRGLGILNVRAMFGNSAVKRSQNLRLIIDLAPSETWDGTVVDRLKGTRKSRNLLGVDVPEIQLPVAPGRNLAVLVETAARNQVLFFNGYDAAEDFVQRQNHYLERNRT